jgi:preprotein translocase subunit SecG
LKAESFFPIVAAFTKKCSIMIISITNGDVIFRIGLVFVVQVQTGKGAEVGAVFGGSSSTIFGSSGAGNFLTRLTTGMAIVFMITSLTLGYFAGKKPTATIFDNRAPAALPNSPAPQSVPVQPQAAPEGGAQPSAPAAPADTKSKTP